MSGACWMFWTVLMPAAQVSSVTEMQITVNVYNAADAPTAEVRKALAATGAIFRKAGIEARFVECGKGPADADPDHECARESGPGLFRIRLEDGGPRAPERDFELGRALLVGRKNGASVFYDRIVSMVSGTRFGDLCLLLAGVIAHELGHLLSGSRQHGEGIMKPKLIPKDAGAIGLMRLLFSRADAKALRAAIRRSNRPPEYLTAHAK